MSRKLPIFPGKDSIPKDRSVLSNKKSPECFYDTGTLEWNGKKLTIKARTALYSYKEIFCGK